MCSFTILRSLLFLVVGLYAIPRSSLGLLAYDCSHQAMNYTKISLSLSVVEDCNFTSIQIDQRSEVIQLVEMKQDFSVITTSCKIEIFRHVTKCKANSYALTHALNEYVFPIGRERCMKAHSIGYLEILHGGDKSMIFRDLEPNLSRKIDQTFKGWTDSHGYCSGSSFKDVFGSYNDVVVTGWVRVTLTQTSSYVNPESNNIKFADGSRRPYDRKECMHEFRGETFWDLAPLDSCESLLHNVLYEGPATVTPSSTRNFMNAIISVSSDSLLFSLAIKHKYKVCNMDAYRTEHPRLVIVRQTGSGFYYKVNIKKSVNDLDLLTYVNSKFVVLERNTHKNMQTLYQDVNKYRCLQNLNIIKTQLSIASIAPIEFAFLYMGQAGYTGTVLGEVIYITRCQGIHVDIRRTETCYYELPVLYKNESNFLLPKSRLLQNYGQEVTCNPIFNANYDIDGAWYSFNKVPVEVKAPHILSPKAQTKWKYRSPSNLASSGIYSQKELEELREHIMHGSERIAIQNVLSRSFTGRPTDMQGGSLYNMLDEEALEKFGESLGNKLWNWFSIFGNISN